MKELTIEEKAKRYGEALHKAKRIINVCVDDNTECRSMIACIQDIFPELKESEDEKIRKGLKEYFINSFQNNGVAAICGIHIKDILAWLEKQGSQILANSAKTCKDEQKDDIGISSTTKQKLEDNLNKALAKETSESWNEFIDEQQHAWSEEDETRIKSIIALLKEPAVCAMDGNKGIIEASIKYLKSLKNRVLPQPKSAWSEEDIVAIDCAVEVLNKDLPTLAASIERLKNLSHKNTWRPSDEQMEALLYEVNAWDEDSVNGQNLKSLYQDLKKLKA